MKKLLLILFLSFTSTCIYAQIRIDNPGPPFYSNGDSYGFSINPIPGAVSYSWSTQGLGNTLIFYASDTLIDIIFLAPGSYDIICVVTMSDNTQVEYAINVGVSEED